MQPNSPEPCLAHFMPPEILDRIKDGLDPKIKVQLLVTHGYLTRAHKETHGFHISEDDILRWLSSDFPFLHDLPIHQPYYRSADNQERLTALYAEVSRLSHEINQVSHPGSMSEVWYEYSETQGTWNVFSRRNEHLMAEFGGDGDDDARLVQAYATEKQARDAVACRVVGDFSDANAACIDHLYGDYVYSRLGDYDPSLYDDFLSQFAKVFLVRPGIPEHEVDMIIIDASEKIREQLVDDDAFDAFHQYNFLVFLKRVYWPLLCNVAETFRDEVGDDEDDVLVSDQPFVRSASLGTMLDVMVKIANDRILNGFVFQVREAHARLLEIRNVYNAHLERIGVSGLFLL